MNSYDREDVISRTFVGGAAILSILSLIFLIGLVISLFGFLPFVGILLGLGVFLFISHWVGKRIVG